MQDTEDMAAESGFEGEEPSFSDPEDFVDDIDDEGMGKVGHAALCYKYW